MASTSELVLLLFLGACAERSIAVGPDHPARSDAETAPLPAAPASLEAGYDPADDLPPAASDPHHHHHAPATAPEHGAHAPADDAPAPAPDPHHHHHAPSPAPAPDHGAHGGGAP